MRKSRDRRPPLTAPLSACPTLSMTWPQYLRNECVIGNRLTKLSPRVMKLFLLLLLRRGMITSRTEAIEWMWPDPDYEPERAQTVVAMCITDLRKVGVPIRLSYGRGFEIGI